MRKVNEQQKLFPELKAFISTDATEWNCVTYLAAKRLFIRMDLSGLNEFDNEYVALADQIDRYDSV